MNYLADNYNVFIRTNDDFNITVTVPYDITLLTPKFNIKKSDGSIIDWSGYVLKTGLTTFIVDVKADVVNTVGVLMATYDCIIDMGLGSKDFLFGGNIEIVKGVS